MPSKPAESAPRPSCSWAVFNHEARKVYAICPTLRRAHDAVKSAFPNAEVQRILPGFDEDALMGAWGYSHLMSQVAKDAAKAGK